MVRIRSQPVSRVREAVGGTLVRGTVEGVSIDHVGEPLEVDVRGLTFVISDSFARDLARTKAEVVVVQESLLEHVLPQLPANVKSCIVCKDAYLALAQFSKLAADADPYQDWRLEGSETVGVHPTARVDPSAKLGAGVSIGEGAVIGPRTTVLPNVAIGPRAEIGADCVLFPGAVVYPRSKIGDRVRLHANAVIGADGFGYARGSQGSTKIWHLGSVVIGDDVEIGAGAMIDRGTLKDTVVERGTKIDNLVQVGHNGWVKAHAILCAQVGLAGNVTVGSGTIMAGKAGVADKVEIGDRAIIGPMAGISKDVAPREVIMGNFPPKPRREWWKLMALLNRLPDLFERVKKIEGNRS